MRISSRQISRLPNQADIILVYGLTEQETIIHISEAENGLACNCKCPGCGSRLIAKQGKSVEHHFSHETTANCGASGPETALHLLAKQILRETTKFSFPPVECKFDNATHTLIDSKTIQITRCEYEPNERKMNFGIVPDLIFFSGEKRCQVEIAVTHKCDDGKIEKLKAAGIATLEIDLSRIERGISAEGLKKHLNDNRLHKWVFHPKIEEKLAELEKKRQLKLQQQQKKLDLTAGKIAKAYRINASTLKAVSTLQVTFPLDFDELEPENFLGIETDGYVCFLVRPEVWQIVVFELLAEDYASTKAGLNSIHICNNVKIDKLVLQDFNHLSTATVNNVRRRVENFAAPWKAIDDYLNSLKAVGIVVNHGKGFLLTRIIGQKYLKHVEQKAKCEKRILCVENVINALLDRLPDEERGSLNYEIWHKRYFDINSNTLENMVGNDEAYGRFTDAAIQLEKLFNFEKTHIENNLGFPVEGAIERSKDQIERRRLKQEAEDKTNRIQRLENDQRLQSDGPLQPRWLSNPHLKLEGKTPIQIAGESSIGLIKAEKLLQEDFNHANAVRNSLPNNNYAKAKGE